MPVHDLGIRRAVICEDIQGCFFERPPAPSGIRCFLTADLIESPIGRIRIPAKEMIPVRYAMPGKKLFWDPNPLSVRAGCFVAGREVIPKCQRMSGQIECSCYIPLNGGDQKSRDILHIHSLLSIIVAVAWPDVRSSTQGTQKPGDYVRRDVSDSMNCIRAHDREPVSGDCFEPPLTFR